MRLSGSQPPDQALLETMADTLVHRGPDSSGFFRDDHVGFAFRRLALVDLEGGNQPLFNEDGSLVMICNGEIFNHRELRQELALRGHRFRTRTDVEVILHLYEEDDAELLAKLNGQFAFAIYDRPRRRVLLARDRFGVNPLHHAVIGGSLVFASEIKAILRHPRAPREVDLTALDQVLSLPGLVSPHTIVRGISSLQAGHLLDVRDGRVEMRQYWDLDYPRLGDLAPASSEPEQIEELQAALEESVRRRLQADVPVGFYLSGGLDSSLMAAAIGRAGAAAERHSFSISFTDPGLDEAPFQRRMAEHVGSIHHEIPFGDDEIERGLRSAVRHAECPLKETYDAASLRLSCCARRNGVVAVLTAEGADELFGGYVGYRFDVHRRTRRRAADVHTLLEDEWRRRVWGDEDLFYEKDYRSFRDTRREIYSTELANELSSFEFSREPLIDPERLRGRHRLHQRSYLDFKLRLVDHLVADHGDRMALAHSVEARYPFLDPDVVDVARRIPPDRMVKDLVEKYPLRCVAQRLGVPEAIVRREKFHFVAPGTWRLLRRRIDWVEDLLSFDRIKRQGFFDPETVEALKKRYRADDFALELPYEDDFLAIVLTFGVLLDELALQPRR